MRGRVAALLAIAAIVSLCCLGSVQRFVGDVSPTARRLLWSETYITEHMALLNHTVPLFDYTPDVIALSDTVRNDTRVGELAVPRMWTIDG